MEIQRSENWFKERNGKFTASEIHKLLGIKGLGLTGQGYAFEKAAENVFGRNEEESFISYDMQRGIDLEPLAFTKFKELKEIDFINVKNCSFFKYGTNAGASPDGMVGTDDCLEIKCPKPNKFFNIIEKGVEAIDKEYIAQMQMQMLASKSMKCYFFNYIIFNGAEMWHEIVINRDEVMIELIKTRIDEAVKLRDEYVDNLINNKQF